MKNQLNKASFIITEHITNSRLFEALDLMKTEIGETASQDLEDTYISVRSRHIKLEKDILDGVLTTEERTVLQNKRVRDLLSLNRLIKNERQEAGTSKQVVRYPEIEETIYKDIECIITGNLEVYEALIHPDSPVKEASIEYFRKVKNLDLKLVIDIQNIEYFDVDERTAIFQLDQYTRVNDPDIAFNANRITYIHMYAKHEGKWLMFKSFQRYTEDLNI